MFDKRLSNLALPKNKQDIETKVFFNKYVCQLLLCQQEELWYSIKQCLSYGNL